MTLLAAALPKLTDGGRAMRPSVLVRSVIQSLLPSQVRVCDLTNRPLAMAQRRPGRCNVRPLELDLSLTPGPSDTEYRVHAKWGASRRSVAQPVRSPLGGRAGGRGRRAGDRRGRGRRCRFYGLWGKWSVHVRPSVRLSCLSDGEIV